MARSTGPCGLLLPLLMLSPNPFLLVLLTHWALPSSLPMQPEGLFCPASLAVFLPLGPHLRAPFDASHSLLLYRIKAKLSLGATPYSKILFLLLIF